MLRSGQICPADTGQLFEARLNQRAQLKLRMENDARKALQELLDEDITLTILACQLESHLSDLPELLGISCKSGPIEVASKPLDQLHFGESPKDILFIGSKAAQLHQAKKMGFFSVAVGSQGSQAADIELADFSAFPNRS